MSLLSEVLTPLRPFLVHQSWRCRDRDRYPAVEWVDDCPCGMVQALVEAGCSWPEAKHIAETIAEAIT